MLAGETSDFPGNRPALNFSCFMDIFSIGSTLEVAYQSPAPVGPPKGGSGYAGCNIFFTETWYVKSIIIRYALIAWSVYAFMQIFFTNMHLCNKSRFSQYSRKLY